MIRRETAGAVDVLRRVVTLGRVDPDSLAALAAAHGSERLLHEMTVMMLAALAELAQERATTVAEVLYSLARDVNATTAAARA